jgi:hypothetical protein
MGGQGKRLVERLKRSGMWMYRIHTLVWVLTGVWTGRGVKGCLVGSRPGADWLDNRSCWLAAGSQLPKEHLSPLPLALCVRVSDKNFPPLFV